MRISNNIALVGIEKNRPVANNYNQVQANSNGYVQQRLHETYRSQSKQLNNDFEFICLICGQRITTPKDNHGKQVYCDNCKQSVTAPSSMLSPGIVINDFILKKQFNQGGAGAVYKAHQISFNRECVIKVLHGKNIDNAPLLHEARLTAKLKNHNIVQCYALDKYDDFYYYAMEYVHGTSLKDLLKQEGKLDYHRALNIITQITTALNYAWKQSKLIHHDITPDNIIINNHDIAKLCDLGLATIDSKHGDDFFYGTPAFTSPENVLGETVSFLGDMYSLGTIFYLMVTGKLPHSDKDNNVLLKKHVTETPKSPKEHSPDLPDSFITVIAKLLNKKAHNRYPSYDDMLEELMTLQVEYNKQAVAKIDTLSGTLARVHMTNSNINNITLEATTPVMPKKHFYQQSIVAKVAIGLISLITMLMIIFFSFNSSSELKTDKIVKMAQNR